MNFTVYPTLLDQQYNQQFTTPLFHFDKHLMECVVGQPARFYWKILLKFRFCNFQLGGISELRPSERQATGTNSSF